MEAPESTPEEFWYSSEENDTESNNIFIKVEPVKHVISRAESLDALHNKNLFSFESGRQNAIRAPSRFHNDEAFVVSSIGHGMWCATTETG